MKGLSLLAEDTKKKAVQDTKPNRSLQLDGRDLLRTIQF
jgi:hypothetical protein